MKHLISHKLFEAIEDPEQHLQAVKDVIQDIIDEYNIELTIHSSNYIPLNRLIPLGYKINDSHQESDNHGSLQEYEIYYSEV